MTLSLEEITTSFQEACSSQSQSMFLQGDILAKAIRDGLTTKEVFRACGEISGKGYHTICNRYKVAKVFPPDKRVAHIDWSLHQLCTTGVDLNKPETYAIGYQWLDLAIKGRETANGWRPHSFASLKTLITANGGKPDAGEPVYILDNVEATYQRTVRGFYGWTYELVIAVEESIIKTMPEFNPALPIFVTIVQRLQVPATEVIP